MIMVASFNKPPEYEGTEGMSPQEAADQLVYELRLKGIPAYSYQQTEIDGTLTTIDRRTNEECAAKTRNWAGGICVLAGNYPTSNDKIAQRTLKFIKSFQPEFLRYVTAPREAGPGELIKRTKSGGVYHVTPNHRFPFSGAFMTVNPELTEEDLALRKHDPFILRLNSGSDYSLLTNPGGTPSSLLPSRARPNSPATPPRKKSSRSAPRSARPPIAPGNCARLCGEPSRTAMTATMTPGSFTTATRPS